MLKPLVIFLFALIVSINCLAQKIQKLSLDLTAKTLSQGKYIALKAEVYYQFAGGLMVTNMTAPFHTISITNANGEMKVYDFLANSVMLNQGYDLSSENSFIYHFLAGATQDMGLKKSGFKLISTKKDGNNIVSIWGAPEEMKKHVTKAEIVHEAGKPIYLAFYGSSKKPDQKIYYTNYNKVGGVNMPLNITEIEFNHTTGDSTITRRLYSNPKTDMQVDNSMLNFKIPANAQIITQDANKK